jgi:hypothetical protein
VLGTQLSEFYVVDLIELTHAMMTSSVTTSGTQGEQWIAKDGESGGAEMHVFTVGKKRVSSPTFGVERR